VGAVACSGGSSSSSSLGSVATVAPSTAPTAAASPTATPVSTGAVTTPPPIDARLTLASGFYGNVVANVGSARELAMLPNGDLLVGTGGRAIDIVPNADAPGLAGTPRTFITLSEGPATSITVAPDGTLYAGTNSTIWKIAYATGDRSESTATIFQRVRTGPVSPGTDGDVHTSTSVVATAGTLYAGVGSSCNRCVETDSTRATVLRMSTSGGAMPRVTNLTTRTRNPIALAINPATGSLWIGGAGQDSLPQGHPYEYFDSPTVHGSTDVDYGWPQCEENHVAYAALGTSPAPDCSKTVAPAIEFPAYATLIGAAFYPATQTGAYAFPAAYRGGVFVTAHGSWHCCPSTPPRLFYVAMSGDRPATAVDWSDPTVQSRDIIGGYGVTSSSSGYIGRPTGVAIGPNGSLFIADDATGNIIRLRHR